MSQGRPEVAPGGNKAYGCVLSTNTMHDNAIVLSLLVLHGVVRLLRLSPWNLTF